MIGNDAYVWYLIRRLICYNVFMSVNFVQELIFDWLMECSNKILYSSLKDQQHEVNQVLKLL